MTRQSRTKQGVNIWKILFFTLLAIILLPILFLILFSSDQGEINTQPASSEGDTMTISVSVDSSDVEQIANIYLDDQAEEGNVEYAVEIDEDVRLYGQARYLGVPFNFNAEMDPVVVANGNVRLDFQSIQLSGFELPQYLTLTILANQIDLPDFIAFNPSESYLAVNLNEFSLENGTKLSVSDFDQEQGEISAQVHLPLELIEPDNDSQ